MIRTYLLEYERLPDPLEQKAALEGLADERIEKIVRLKQPGARKQSLGAGLLIDHVRKKAGAGAQITYNSFGRPFVEGIPFSISHTEHYVMLSMWDRKAQQADGGGEELLIGCDIEQARPYNPKIARRFFTETEYQNLEAAAGGMGQDELFCRYWTRKESVMKLTGLGMALPMDFFDVCAWQAVADRKKIEGWHAKMKEKRQEECCQAAEILLQRQLFFKEYWQGGCCMTVCSTKNLFAEEAVFLTQVRCSGMDKW